MGWRDYMWDKWQQAADDKNWDKAIEIAQAIQAERDAEAARKQAEAEENQSKATGWFGRRK